MKNKNLQSTKAIHRSSLVPCPLSLVLLSEVDIGQSFTFQGNTAAGSIAEFQTVGSLLSKWLPNAYIAGGVIVFFFLLVAGFKVITGAGEKEKIEEARKMFTSAIIGLLVLAGSYWIIQIIQVITGVKILNSGI